MGSRHARATNIGEYIPFHIFQLTPTTGNVANPTVQATGAAASGSVLPLGTYTIAYTFRNTTAGSTAGQTTIGTSTSASITTSVSNSQAILTGSVTLPTGATNIDWYIISGPSGAGFVGTQTATGTFTINVLPTVQSPYTINTLTNRVALPGTASAAAAAGTEIMDFGHGVFLGPVIINSTGTSALITLYNGNGGNQNSVISQISPGTNVTLAYDCIVENGVYYTQSGSSAASLTICALPVAI